MFKEYSTYEALDFLIDDYFVDTMLEPTPESEVFWKGLINNNKINTNEFISAYMMLKGLHENRLKASPERFELLWERITETNRLKKQKIKYFQILRYVAVACSIVSVVSISIFSLLRTENVDPAQSITDFAMENIIHTKESNNVIQLVSGNQTLAVTGTQAKLEYDITGKLKVNQKNINIKKVATISKDLPVYNQLSVPYGKRAILKLSDGSILWLNTGTTVTYPTTFAKDKREIFVDGEVYADVFHDLKRPFIIKTEKLDVQVLGTVLNVTAYKNDKQTNVVLVSGSVNVKPKNGKATIIKPNQLYGHTDQASTLRTVDVENYISWHDGIYIFHNEPIEDVLLRLSRYYNVTMSLPLNPSGISCSGKLELKDDLNQLLDGLTEITSLSYGVENDKYKIKFD